MENKKTLVIGASPNEERYSYKAVKLLNKYGNAVEALGVKNGNIGEIEIQKGFPPLTGIHTVSLYIGKVRQPDYYEYILSLKPERIIFNPGTENTELQKLADDAGILTVEDCTLVMLNNGRF
jgi:hypothetical protein